MGEQRTTKPVNETPAKRTYRKLDETFRRKAVQNWLYSGKSAEVIAGDFCLNSNLLYAWRKSFAPADAGGRAAEGAKPTTLAEALTRIDADQREIRHLREQRDIFKKNAGHSLRTATERYQWIDTMKTAHPIALGLTANGAESTGSAPEAGEAKKGT